MNVREEAHKMKLAAPHMAAAAMETRNGALQKIVEALEANKEKIFEENGLDVKAAQESGVAQSVVKRLKFDEGKLRDAIAGIRQMMDLEDPVGKVTLKRELDQGLVLERVTVPIGVIGVIFEMIPTVTRPFKTYDNVAVVMCALSAISVTLFAPPAHTSITVL